jgi:pimeloyl-ACP methyl ester carboxylesterase
MVIPFSSSEELAAVLPDCELKRVRGAGHLVQLEFPEVVSKAVDRLVQRAFAHDARNRRAVGV